MKDEVPRAEHMREFLAGTNAGADLLNAAQFKYAPVAKTEADRFEAQCQALVREHFATVRRTIHASDSAAAIQAIQQIYQSLRRESSSLVNRYGSIQWLWYLRRTSSRWISHKTESITLNRLMIAEAMSSESRADSQFFMQAYKVCTPQINQDVCVDIAKLLVLASTLMRLKSTASRLTKCADIDTTSDYPLTVTTRRQDYALALEDFRGSRADAAFVGLGRAISPLEKDISDFKSMVMLFAANLRPQEVAVPPYETYNGEVVDTVVSNWAPMGFQLADVVASTVPPSLQTASVWPSELGMLVQLNMLATLAIAVDTERMVDALTLGYIGMSTEFFEQVFREMLPHTRDALSKTIPFAVLEEEPNRVMQILSRPLETTGLASPCMRLEQDACFIDLFRCTHDLQQAFRFPDSRGAQDKPRADQFEDDVQSLIDASKWKPVSTRQYLRRDLKYGGATKVEIDAIGECGDLLLCVSCKSIVAKPEFLAAEPVAVQAVISRVRDATEMWNKRMQWLREHLVGENYDLARRRIVGVVCVPHVPFVDWGTGTEWALPGLRRVVSWSELRLWLSGETPESGLFPGNEFADGIDPMP